MIFAKRSNQMVAKKLIRFNFIHFRFIFKNNGVLFENDLIQIGVKSEFRQNLGRLGLFYGNKTQVALQVQSSPIQKLNLRIGASIIRVKFSFLSIFRIEFPASFDMVTGECIEIECSNQTRRTNSGSWCTNSTNAHRRMHRRLCR